MTCAGGSSRASLVRDSRQAYSVPGLSHPMAAGCNESWTYASCNFPRLEAELHCSDKCTELELPRSGNPGKCSVATQDQVAPAVRQSQFDAAFATAQAVNKNKGGRRHPLISVACAQVTGDDFSETTRRTISSLISLKPNRIVNQDSRNATGTAISW